MLNSKMGVARLMVWVAVGVLVVSVASARAADKLKKPSLAVNLPEAHNTPDGMALDGKGNIILSCPNFNTNVEGNEQPAWLMKITPNDKLEKFIKMPVHPETGKACPLGIGFASDGNLYVADSQGLGGDNNYKSRLLRVVINSGKPVRVESVVEGFIVSNAVACYGDSVYVTETLGEPEPGPGPMASAVYRFKISELSGKKPIQLAKGLKDKHVCVRLTTKNEEWKIGANGLGFAKDGTMYIGNFGDAQIIAVKFCKEGKVVSQKVIAEGDPIKSADGLKVCPKTGLIYLADFLGNAVHCIDPKTGKVKVLAQNGVTNGEGGLLDKCSEVGLRGNRLYVSNIDLSLDGNEFDKPYTISVIELDK